MNSKERIINAMKGKDVDYLPCSIYFNPNLEVPGYDLSKATERNRLGVDLGTDPVVNIETWWTTHPDVEIEVWEEKTEACEFPLLWQRWKTPKGDLTQAIKRTPEIDSWDNIFWDDFSTSNMHKPLITCPEDVELIPYVYHPLTSERLEQIRTEQKDLFEQAEKKNLATMATYGQGLAVAMFMMGAENLLYFSIDYPEAFNKIATYIHQTEMKNIEMIKTLGIDILKRFGGYEMTNFFTPDVFTTVLSPLLREEVEKAHELDMMIFYRVVTGMEPVLEDIAKLGFDCIEGGEPHLSNCSLENWHEVFFGKSCSWTGVSTPVILGADTPETAREEVRRVIDFFGRKSFILGVTNSIRNHFPWENTLAMVDEWKKHRKEA